MIFLNFFFRNWEDSRETLSARANWEMAVKTKRLGKNKGLVFQPEWLAAHMVQCCFIGVKGHQRWSPEGSCPPALQQGTATRCSPQEMAPECILSTAYPAGVKP